MPASPVARRLRVAGIFAIVLVAGAPLALDQWRAHRFEQERQAFIAAKDREIACLEALKADVTPGMDVTAELDRCRALATDPETGIYRESFP